MQWFTVAATSAVISALVAGLLTLWNSHLQRKADERRRLGDLAMKMAMAEWESHIKLANEGRAGNIPPPEIYLYRYSKLLPLIEGNKVNPENIQKIDTEVAELNMLRRRGV